MITLKLGSDAMGSNVDEPLFYRWVDRVDAHIEDKTGLSVIVGGAWRDGSGGSTEIRGADTAEEALIREALNQIWDDWCRAGAPGVTR